MAEAEEEEEGQVEASLEELIAKKADRPTITDDEDDESLLATGRDEARLCIGVRQVAKSTT